MVIVDHYGLSDCWETLMRQYSRDDIKIMSIDDFTHRSHNCDFYLNQNLLGADSLSNINNICPINVQN